MKIDRVLLKLDARERMRRYQPNPVVIGLIVFLVAYVLEYLMLSVLGLNFKIQITNQNIQTAEELVELLQRLQRQFLAHFHPSAFAVILACALLLMELMINTGHTIYALHVSREEKADYGNLLDGFALFLKIVVLSILEGAIVYVMTLLLVIPGLIMAYRYRQAIYLLLDHPDRSPIDCLRGSGALMQGRKWELFVLDLSFLGWNILRSLVPIIAILLAPYQQLTYANYYRTLIGEPVPANSGPQVFEGQFREIPNEDDDQNP